MAMSELGAFLQRHREDRGLTLDDVEELTRIRRAYLEAIEAGAWSLLPPGVYTRGLLRNYARALGVSQASVMRMYVKERPQEARLPEPQLINHPLVNEPRISIELVLAVVVMAVAVVLMLWIGRTYVLPVVQEAGVGADATEPVGAMPARTATRTPETASGRATTTRATRAVTADGPATPSPRARPSAAPSGSPAASGSPAPGGGQVSTVSPLSTGSPAPGGGQVSTAGPLSTGSPAPARSPAAPSGLLVEIRASGNAWLRIFVDGEPAFENFLREGDAWKGEAKERIRIRMGNAGDTQITLNGRPAGALGGRGEVVEREWRLGADGNIVQIDEPE